MKFLINCDLGEVEHASDLEMQKLYLRYIDLANIACGGHAGSDEVMIELLKWCKNLGVLSGAHPSYPDRKNFGRNTLKGTTDEIRRWTSEQVRRLLDHAAKMDMPIHHVKPHGALYHDAMNDVHIAEAFILGVLDANENWCYDAATIRSVESSDPAPIRIVGQSGSKLEHICIREGLPFLSEAFADRRYLPSGALQSRAIPGSVLKPDEALEQMKSMISSGTVNATKGPIPIKFDTVCVHGDSPNALSILESISNL